MDTNDPNHITRHLKKQYFESDSVCEDIEYEYDGWKRSEFVHDYVNRENRTLSNGDVKIREYKRVADYPLLIKYSTRAERGLFILQRHRIWNLMVEESLYLRKSSQQTRSLLKSEIREYTQATPFINKTPSYGDSLFHLGVVYQTALQDPLANYEPSRVENNRFTYSSELFKKKISYDRYGHTGNLLEYTDDKEVPCSYIWGCHNQLPIAEIKGVRYSQIEDLYGGGTNGYWSLFYQGASLKLSLGFFRNMALLRSQNPYCNLSIYQYKTLVGLTVLTDNMGVNTYYRYDWLGRLDQVYRIDDGVKQILQQYDCHYVQTQ